MRPIQDKIDKLMDQHSIRFYVDLLIMIGKQLGVKDPYGFAEKEKSNFTKMLKGQRPLKHEYIIPLEKIFGVPMAKMLYGDEYETSFSKDDLPFIKGFRYYAYKDDPKLYNGEFERNLVDIEGRPYIRNTDEYGKWFLDYIVEYKAINGLRYLVEKHHLRADPIRNSRVYRIEDEGGFDMMMTTVENSIDYLIVEEDLDDVFDSMYDPYYPYIHLRRDYYDSVFKDKRFISIILNTKKIFKNMFITREIEYGYANDNIVASEEKKHQKIKVLNPLINVCLNYALEHLDKYKEQAKAILTFGIEYNPKALKETGERFEDLNTREFGNVCYQNGYEFLANIVFPEVETNDRECSSLIERLSVPKYVRF